MLLVFVLIEVPAVQNFARKKAVAFLENKIKTKVEINHISLELPKLVVLEDIYFEDQKKDTLIAGDTLSVDISMMKLLDNQVEINEIDLRGITANIQRTPDSVFNFAYIIEAFAGEQKKEPTPQDTSAGMRFSVEKINFDRIKATFKDALTANDVNVYLGHFDTRVKEFDLDKMKFAIPKITLSGVNATIIQSKPLVTTAMASSPDTAASKPLNMALELGTFDLKKIKVNYRNDVSAMKADVNLGNLVVESKAINLKGQQIALESLDFTNSAIAISLGKKQAAKVVAKVAVKEAEAAANNWKFTLAKANIENNDIMFDNLNIPAQHRGMDFARLHIKDFTLNAESFVYTLDTIAGTINEGSFSEKSGFKLTKLNTNFFYGKTKAYFKDLELHTPFTTIRDRIEISYPSIESLSKNLGELSIDANLKNNRLGFRDILTFVPTLAGTPPFDKNPNATLNINGKVEGKLKNLNIPRLQISGLGSTRIDASARIKGLPDVNKSYFDVTIRQFSSRKSDLVALMPQGTLPANIRLPERFSLTGTFKGGITNFNTNLNLNSDFGSAKAIAAYNARVKGRETYKANVRVFNFNVGRLLKQEKTIGRVTVAANVAGTGTNPKNLNARFSGKVIKAGYNGYTYRNLNLSGGARNGAISAKANMADSNLDFDLSATANMKKKYPAVTLNLDLDSANFKALNFTKDDMRFHGKLIANLPTADPDYLNGTIDLTNALFVKGTQRVQMDTISIKSKATADSNSLSLKSDIIDAHLFGKYKLTQLGTAVQALVDKYYDTSPGSKSAKYTPQYLTFRAKVVSSPVLTQFVPALTELAPVEINGNFDSRNGDLNLTAKAPHIVYGTNNINNLNFDINTGNNALNYSVNLGNIAGTQFQVANTSITGNAKNNILLTDIRVRDKSKKDHYRIAGTLKAIQSAYEFSLQPNGLLLNYQPWAVAQNNFIRFGTEGIEARDFTISNNNQSLSVNTKPPGANNPLAVDFANFKIETLTQIAKKDSLLVGGTINGGAVVRNLQATPVFTSDLNIADFNFRGDTVGNVSVKVNNEQANSFAANVSITGKGNQVDLKGNYFTGNSSFNMNLNIANLNLKSIEGFTIGNMKNASGSIKGNFDISGNTTAPKVAGALNFNQAAFTVGMLNSYFKIDDASKINATERGINFNDFTLIDSAGNRATVAGDVLTTNFTDYKFALSVNSDNFQVLNSTAKDNELYYGKLLVETRLHIGGTTAAPSVDGSLKINPKTSLSVVLPQSDPAMEEREGIVEFVDRDNPELAKILQARADSAVESGITGMDVSVNITIDKEAEFNLIVDAANGDFVKLRGEAELNGGIDPSGKISLTGMYTMQEGAYELSFNFLRRRFDIKPGSTITWNGDLMDANLDLTAIYIAKTAPLDLVAGQLGDAPPAILNTYKQQLPFEVHLTMKGELMKPVLTFDVLLPEKNYNVSAEITDNVETRLTQLRTEPSELNKQVFALLLLNRFVSDNPFKSSGGGGGVESLARQSVSKLLSQQLNNLAGDLFGGVELNFDLESSDDYTTGQLKNRTDLNVGLSKKLLNDRLKVTVGSNFELEGPRQPNRSTNNIAGNVDAEYQLTKDGRYLLRAYQKNEYQVALQGQVVETGVGFVITMDYNKFKELFQRTITAEDKKRRRAERKAKKQADNDNEEL